MAYLRWLVLSIFALMVAALPLRAADSAKIFEFMQVTGFDVSLESLRVSARDAPTMLGLDADDFGLSWTRLADRLFEPEDLKRDALEILQQALRDDVLQHAATFYSSELGQRLVEAENESHFLDSTERREEGELLAAALMERASPQPEYFLDMAESIGSVGASIKSYREVQVRFLMAASGAGLVQQRFDELDLRAMLAQQDAEARAAIEKGLVISNAFTYRDFTDVEMQAYRDALATEMMIEVYALMNAIHFTIMADRYEKMAVEMVKLAPIQEL
jgi:hypothetical protein